MHAYTGYWDSAHYLAWQRKRLAEAADRARVERRKHRSLPRQQRLVADLERTRTAMLKLDKVRPRTTAAALANNRRYSSLVRRWNRLVDALNAYEGTSQQVAHA